MCIQPNLEVPDDVVDGFEVEARSVLHLGQLLLQEAVRVRKSFNYVENHTVRSIVTSFFLFGSYFCMNRHNAAWFHLREATTLAQLMALNEESTYTKMKDTVESAVTRRLYWLLFSR